MRRRGTLLLLALLLHAGGCRGPAPRAESLLLVTIDTLRADHVHLHGGPHPTPALDALAAAGVAVRQAYTPTPTTGPAHASLLTGLHPWRHGVLNNAVPVHPEMPTLARLLQAQGLATAAFVSSYVLHPRYGFHAGFDHYELVATEPSNWHGLYHPRFYAQGADVTAHATAWLEAHAAAGGGRFFLWVHYFDPHLPYEPPAKFAPDPDEPVDLAGKELPVDLPDRETLAQMIRAYRGEVRSVDAEVGALVAALDGLGLGERTAVIVTSDHGEGLGDHGVMDHGQNLFEEQVRVPLLVRGPGIPARGAVDGLAQLEDLMPTALALLGAPIPPELDGVDLAPWLRGEVDASPRAAVLGRRKETAGEARLFFRLDGGGKWIGELDGPGRRYDLRADPREGGGERAAAPEAFRRRVAIESEVIGAQELDDEARRALEALGYLEPEAEREGDGG